MGAYHAGLTEETKFFIRQNFSSKTSEMRCLCATVAFGMVRFLIFFDVSIIIFLQGMDIPDIRVVIVYWVPTSISQYYQVLYKAAHFIWALLPSVQM